MKYTGQVSRPVTAVPSPAFVVISPAISSSRKEYRPAALVKQRSETTIWLTTGKLLNHPLIHGNPLFQRFDCQSRMQCRRSPYDEGTAVVALRKGLRRCLAACPQVFHVPVDGLGHQSDGLIRSGRSFSQVRQLDTKREVFVLVGAPLSAECVAVHAGLDSTCASGFDSHSRQTDERCGAPLFPRTRYHR